MSGHAPEAPTAPLNAAEAAIGAELDALKTFRHAYVAPILLGFIMLFDSWDSIAIAYVMPSLSKEWSLGPAAIGTLISSGYVGQFLGAILLGTLAERFGRMPVLLWAVLIMGLLALGCALAPNYNLMLAIRFVQGFAIGGALPVSIAYINELAKTQTRGRYFAIFQWLCMSGYAAASLSSAWIIPNLGWRWLLGIGAIPLVLLPFVAAILPESPRWLARVGRVEDANKAVRKLGGQGAATAFTAAETAAFVVPKIPISSLFSGGYGRRTVIILALWFFTAFTNFGLTTWSPSIYVTAFHLPLADALRYSAAPAVLFLVATAVIAFIVDKLGRRPPAIIGSAAAGVTLLIMAFAPPSDPNHVVALVITGSLGISIASLINWPYTAENYPTHMRAVALGVCSSMARGASMLTPLFVGWMLASGGSISVVFGVFGALATVVLLLWLFATRETARTNLENV